VNRIEKLRGSLASHEVDALLVTSEVNVRYLTGFTGDSTFLLVTETEATLLSDRRYEEQIAAECPHLAAEIRGPDKPMLQLVRQVWESVSAHQPSLRFGLEAEHVSWSLASQISDTVAPGACEATTGVVESLRQIKDAEEIDRLRRAVAVAEGAFRSVVEGLHSDQTERELAYALEAAIRERGGSGCGFPPIVAVGANAARPHAQPGANRLSQSPLLLVDWGALLEGYTSDLTRVLFTGLPTDAMAEVYGIVLEAQQAAIAAIGAGVPLCQVDAAARDTIAAAGYGDRFGHGLGHGIGLQVHEAPRMASTQEELLQAGMVVTVEPGIYLPGQFGVRLEDDVLVTETGCEVLSKLPKGLEAAQGIL
jgi:Xaa-Pro aminopeptidase